MVGEPAEIIVGAFQWEAAVEEHIARHGLERTDVEEARNSRPMFFENLPGRTATHVMLGRDTQGRILYVAIRFEAPPDVWKVITAWESRLARRLWKEHTGEEL